FKSYTEKVWGVPATEIKADWAAQRIKNLSLFNAAVNAMMPKRNQKEITSLIEEFQYPKYGPGMLWEKCGDLAEAGGGKVDMEHKALAVHHDGAKAYAVTVEGPDGTRSRYDASAVISSMPIGELVCAMDPPVPDEVDAAARGLSYRSHLSIALVVPDD